VVMRSYILWDIMPCSPFKVNWRFRGTSLGVKCNQSKKPALSRVAALSQKTEFFSTRKFQINSECRYPYYISSLHIFVCVYVMR
jgi:hypothetical protein